MPSVHSKILAVAITIALLLQSVNLFEDVDDDLIQESETEHKSIDVDKPPSVATLPPKDIYSEIYNTVWFKHHTGVCEDLFDYIHAGIAFDITEARNTRFKYSDEDNYARRRRPCKISTQNRVIHFLHTMRTGGIVWDNARDNNWNIASVSEDFHHVSEICSASRPHRIFSAPDQLQPSPEIFVVDTLKQCQLVWY